jgi:hypothetical protein
MPQNLDWRIFDQLTSKVERAEKHIVDLCAEWDRFKVKAYKVSANDDLNSGERIWRLDRAWPIPDTLSLIVGDAAHGLRCALDHLIYRLVLVHTRGVGPFKNLYFPVGSDRVKFFKRLKEASEHKATTGGIVQRLRPEAIKAIEAIEPYEGGKGRILWNVHQLDIFDKHRSLVTATLSIPTLSMPPDIIASYAKSIGVEGRYTPQEEALIFQTDSSAPFPLNEGDIIHRVPITKANENMKFTFMIAFREPQVLKGKAIAVTLHQAVKLIRDITRTFFEDGFLS